MPTKRALIVDDSTTAQYRLKKMLRSYDLQIDTVDSGEAALLHLANHVPDVIFMDHLMPGMDGFRALQIIKSHPETAMIPVIMYTSKSGDVYTGQARALGALDVINKDTINATDLSKVMRSIHIYPPEEQASETEAEAADFRIAANDVSPPAAATHLRSEHSLQPRLQAEYADNSRRIELRISQLEHAIDDSRRVITARLIREMQKLRANISHEFNEHFVTVTAVTNPSKSAPAPIFQEPTQVPSPKAQSNWPIFLAMILILIVCGLMLRSFNKLDAHMVALSEQQAEQRHQLEVIDRNLQDTGTALKIQVEQQRRQNRSVNRQATQAAMLDDLVQAFNQNATIPFHEGVITDDATARLNEFVNALDQQGFKGAIWVKLSVGNFCVVTDNAGLPHLPAAAVSMGDCVLLSELYRIENLLSEATDEINASTNQLPSVNRGDISVVVSGPEQQLVEYPARQPHMLASEWNRVAQSNNRLTIELSDLGSIQ